jgi:hypothetical protein
MLYYQSIILGLITNVDYVIYLSVVSSPMYEGVFKSFRTESHNEIYAYNNKRSLRSNTKGYGGKTH